jgi:hypothetical protein
MLEQIMAARMRGIRQTGRPRRRCMDEFEEDLKLMGSGHTPERMEEEFIGSHEPRRILVLEEEEEEKEKEEEEEKKKKKKKNCFVIGLMSSFCSF